MIGNRAALEKKFEELNKRYKGKQIPLPADWGGYCLVPMEFEFWKGGAGRLHDRLLYTQKKAGTWGVSRLSP